MIRGERPQPSPRIVPLVPMKRMPLFAHVSAGLQLGRSRRHQAALVPRDPNRRHAGAGREVVVDQRGGGADLFRRAVAAGLDLVAIRLIQLQGPEGRVQVMAGEVADRAGAELPPGPPADRRVVRMIRPGRHRIEPAFPVEARRHRRRVLRPVGQIGPAAGPRVGPGVHLPDVADRAVPDPLAVQADVLAGVAEVAELRGDAGLAGGLGDDAGLVDRPAQRLLAVECLPLAMTASETTACEWSGVATRTASMSSLSSISL